MSLREELDGPTILMGVGAAVVVTAVVEAMRGPSPASIAEVELKKWGGGLKETDPAAIPLIRGYWKSARVPFSRGDAWSAAFIQYVTGGVMIPTGGHMAYAGGAMRGIGPYRVFRSSLTSVRKGDLILRNRDGGSLVFENIGRGGGFSHADIVTKVTSGVARAIGGNKRNNVAVENYYLTSDGRVTDPRVFAILRRG